jgi:hypothetical protein
MKITYIVSVCILFASCLTEKKVNGWLRDHPTEAAKYCSTEFAPDTTTITEFKYVDSSGYKDAYYGMSDLADSLVDELNKKANAATTERPYKPNIDSLRAVIDKEIRKRLKPCVDSVVHVNHVVVDKAREKYLQGLIDQKDGVITGMQKENQGLREKLTASRKWFWLFCGLTALIGAYVFVKIRYKLPI